MQKVSYRRHRFPIAISQHAVGLYFRFPLGYRDVEDLRAKHGGKVSYEPSVAGLLKFGPAYTGKLRRLRPRADCCRHLDQVIVSINGKRTSPWRAIDFDEKVLGPTQ